MNTVEHWAANWEPKEICKTRLNIGFIFFKGAETAFESDANAAWCQLWQLFANTWNQLYNVIICQCCISNLFCPQTHRWKLINATLWSSLSLSRFMLLNDYLYLQTQDRKEKPVYAGRWSETTFCSRRVKNSFKTHTDMKTQMNKHPSLEHNLAQEHVVQPAPSV